MTKDNPAGLRIAPEKFHLADVVMMVLSILITVIALYFAIADGVRDFWLLVLVGIVAAILLGKRLRRNSAGT